MKKLTFSLVVFLLFAVNLLSQPDYYNYNATTGGENSFPLNQPAGKCVQWLVLANEFNTPTPAPAGNITKFYARIASSYPLGPATYTTFKLLLGQTTITSLTSGTFYSGTMDTVYARASVTLQASGGTWLEFILDHPFPYDPTKSLVIQMEQCGASGTTSGYSLTHTNASGNRRVWSVGGCPFSPYASTLNNVLNCGITVAPASQGPNYLYYKFEDNPTSTSTPNCGFPGVGTNPASVTGLTFTPGGQFDTCITGTGASGAGVTTGWNCNLGSSSWTISMWITIPSTSTGSALYLFGDAGSGSFRCFHNGVAGQNNLVLRGTGVTDVNVTGIGPAPTVVTFVYDSAAGNIKAYKDGVLANTVAQTLNITTGTGFKVGGYSTSASFVGKMDEFRLYRRALDAAEITATWNTDLACGTVTGISYNNNNIPNVYSLAQNYPNPFNPVTKISFSLPKAGNVKLVVYDVLGKEVTTLVNDFRNAGTHSVEFNASNLASGLYFYRIDAGSFTDTKKMMLVK